MKSLNAAFIGPQPIGLRLTAPLGESIALKLRSELTSRGWNSDDVENWRDCGWSLRCRRGASELAVTVAAEHPMWHLQISPIRIPGALGRLLGRIASATPAETYALASEVHQLLTAAGFANFLWCWDASPNATSSPVPTPAGQ